MPRVSIYPKWYNISNSALRPNKLLNVFCTFLLFSSFTLLECSSSSIHLHSIHCLGSVLNMTSSNKTHQLILAYFFPLQTPVSNCQSNSFFEKHVASWDLLLWSVTDFVYFVGVTYLCFLSYVVNFTFLWSLPTGSL